ncbi:MAG: hypothetical protein ACLPGW_05890 [Roseiarcus sp.]
MPIDSSPADQGSPSPSEAGQKLRIGAAPVTSSWSLARGARDIAETPLAVADFIQIRFVAPRLDAVLQGRHFVVATDDGDGSEFEAFAQRHRADSDLTVGGFDLVAELDRGNGGKSSATRRIFSTRRLSALGTTPILFAAHRKFPAAHGPAPLPAGRIVEIASEPNIAP